MTSLERTLIVAAVLLVLVASLVGQALPETWPGMVAALFYVAHLWIYTGHEAPLLEHTWTLSLEEHFYLVWPALLGLVLWFRRRELAFDEWVTALMFFYAVNYAFYAIVPAMGPRYFQAAYFDGPVPGMWFATQLDLMFRDSPLARDCFPSGHTGITLLVLGYAWREERRFFYAVLPVGVLLIVGTLAGRFHYGIDLVAAVPLTVTSLAVAAALKRRLPEGVVVGRVAAWRRARAMVRGEG